MTNSVQERLLYLRAECLQLTRQEFSDLTGIPAQTLASIELRARIPGGDTLQKIAAIYPELILWLLTGLHGVEQESPAIYMERNELERALEKVKQQGFTVTKN